VGSSNRNPGLTVVEYLSIDDELVVDDQDEVVHELLWKKK